MNKSTNPKSPNAKAPCELVLSPKVFVALKEDLNQVEKSIKLKFMQVNAALFIVGTILMCHAIYRTLSRDRCELSPALDNAVLALDAFKTLSGVASVSLSSYSFLKEYKKSDKVLLQDSTGPTLK